MMTERLANGMMRRASAQHAGRNFVSYALLVCSANHCGSIEMMMRPIRDELRNRHTRGKKYVYEMILLCSEPAPRVTGPGYPSAAGSAFRRQLCGLKT